MTSELKVYNQFREVILHIRVASGDEAGFYTIDATDEMKAAISNIRGLDFDRTVGKGNELLRFTAKWGSPEYAQVLARYLVNNFGWTTKLVETQQPSVANSLAASGSYLCYYVGTSRSLPEASYSLVAKVTTEDPEQHPSPLVDTTTTAAQTVELSCQP